MLSNEELLQILSQSRDAAAVYDSANLNIRFVNDAMLRIWGKGRSIVGKTFEEALPEIEGQPFPELLKNTWQTGETYTASDTPATLMIDGELKTSFFDFEFKPIVNGDGRTYAILHTASDVSSRMQALKQISEKQLREEQLIAELSVTTQNVQAANENLTMVNHSLIESNENINRLNERLQESETDFKRMVEQAPVAILVFRGKDLVIDLVNHAMLEILDKDESVIGKPLLEGLPEIKGAPAVDMLFEVFKTGKSFDGSESPVPMKRNGKLETRYFNFSYRPLLDQGRIIGVMDVAVEVTDQVLARKALENTLAEKVTLEQTLRANEQRLQGILDTMAEGVVIVDASCKPTYANPTAQKIMGINEQGFRNRIYNDEKWHNFRIDGSELPSEEHPMHLALRTAMAVYDYEIFIVMPSGSKIYISVNAVPLLNEQGEVTGGIATFADVTGRRMVMQQKDDFISVASHELKTPVTSLKASLQLLDRIQDNISPEILSKLLKQANKSLNKLGDLVNSLLNTNRLSQGHFPVNKKLLSLKQLVNDCCQHIRTAGKHKLILQGDIDLQVVADEHLLDQVFVNLINNAAKYAPNSKEIIIEIKRSGTEAKVSITDFGPGIPKDKLPHLFDRYYQAEYDRSQFPGLGLGLYICYEIIQRHGGTIGAESEPGHGSTFWFTLPLE